MEPLFSPAVLKYSILLLIIIGALITAIAKLLLDRIKTGEDKVKDLEKRLSRHKEKTYTDIGDIETGQQEMLLHITEKNYVKAEKCEANRDKLKQEMSDNE